MNAVSAILRETIQELQSLPGLKNSALGGGTSLALRYNHRESIDIDLLFSGLIGKAGFNEIEYDVRTRYGNAIFGLGYPCNEDDQFIFLRFYVRKGNEQIKVEILQNMCFMEDTEHIDGIRTLSERDIGMLKLMAASNRCSFKDIYDLKYITDNIPLIEIFNRLKEKQLLYRDACYKTIFDLDNEVSPVNSPTLLLKFDEDIGSRENRPNHSIRHFKIADGISWAGAKANWRRKVRELFNQLKIDFPGSG